MNLIETKKLLVDVAMDDNRRLSEELATAWHAILSPLDLGVAREALILARRDSSISYLEPRHIVSWAKEVAFQRDKLNKEPEPLLSGDPAPRCRHHSKKILDCDPCCQQLGRYAVTATPEEVEKYARSEIYA